MRHDFGLRVPEDIAIVGFDDIPMASMRAISLTTYRQPYEVMVDMLLGRAPAQSLALQGQMMVRSTT